MRSSGGFQLLKNIESFSSDSLYQIKTESADRKVIQNTQKLLQAGESMVLVHKLIKINRWEYRQPRTLILTNLFVYNLKDGQLRRKICLENIQAISLSLTSSEFVLHVPSEYDLRLDSDSRVTLISQLARTRVASYIYSKQLLVFTHPDQTLERITVTQDIVKKKTYRKLYLQESTPIRYKLNNLSLEINRRVNAQRQGEGDILFIDNEFSDRFFYTEMQPIMKLNNAESCSSTLLRCIKSRKLYSSKKFLKCTLNVSVEFFRNCLLNHQNNPFKQHLYLATQLEDSFVLIFKFYTCGDLYGQRNFKETEYPESSLKYILVRSILAVNSLVEQEYKPLILQNILVDNHGKTFLADYIHFTQEQGREQYLSPEEILQIMDSSKLYDRRMCNIWRLGILIYELTFGVTPFSMARLLWSIENNTPLQINFPTQACCYSNSFKQVIRKLLSIDPQARPGFKGMKDFESLTFLKDVDWEQYKARDFFPPIKYHFTDIEFEAYEFGGAKILFS